VAICTAQLFADHGTFSSNFFKLFVLFSVARSVRQRCEREERHHHSRVEGKDDISNHHLFL
jgi:hypothetical protein